MAPRQLRGDRERAAHAQSSSNADLSRCGRNFGKRFRATTVWGVRLQLPPDRRGGTDGWGNRRRRVDIVRAEEILGCEDACAGFEGAFRIVPERSGPSGCRCRGADAEADRHRGGAIWGVAEAPARDVSGRSRLTERIRLTGAELTYD